MYCVNIHSIIVIYSNDLLKMHKAFWGGAEISLVDTSTALSSEAQ